MGPDNRVVVTPRSSSLTPIPSHRPPTYCNAAHLPSVTPLTTPSRRPPTYRNTSTLVSPSRLAIKHVHVMLPDLE
ncbi:hypothetical protein E2C01_075002 [Portunus trituberculatus]|uniref:Uncharacterized protein n=1 Tax=Portunus trituberculatus TaxID=210409 RepID=A0A5B7IDS9_PORTR|nr:hypothetical protein [Portunus trituberculatus]